MQYSLGYLGRGQKGVLRKKLRGARDYQVVITLTYR